MRARRVRTTVADPAAARAPDLVRRRFRSARPDALHVADFTYVPLHGAGFGYTAFVIDAYAGLIVGWECSLTRNSAFVERAIRAAAARRAREGHPLSGDTIHHSDAGSQYTAIHFTETLMLAGLTPSVGTVGDALDNAVAETTIGLYKTECVRDGSPVPHRAAAHAGRHRGRHLRVGALVQHSQTHAPPGPTPTGRSRGRVLRSPPGRAAHRSHITRCA
jgi:putative transposase